MTPYTDKRSCALDSSTVARNEAIMRLNEADMSTTHKTRQILVVDDDEMIREMSKMMLSLLGYKANAVPSGEAALEYLKKNSVDLVLLDMALGKGMDGLDTYLRILELNENQKAIIISGYSEPERLKQAQLLGADYVRKPFDMRTIGAAVQAQFGKEKI